MLVCTQASWRLERSDNILSFKDRAIGTTFAIASADEVIERASHFLQLCNFLPKCLDMCRGPEPHFCMLAIRIAPKTHQLFNIWHREAESPGMSDKAKELHIRISILTISG